MRCALIATAILASTACSSTPEQRLATRLRGTTWEGGVSDPGTLYAGKGHDGESVTFGGDSTIVFTRIGTSFDATYTIPDSNHIRVRPSGPAGLVMGERTFLVNVTNGDTLRMLPTPFPNSAAEYGEWLRRRDH